MNKNYNKNKSLRKSIKNNRNKFQNRLSSTSMTIKLKQIKSLIFKNNLKISKINYKRTDPYFNNIKVKYKTIKNNIFCWKIVIMIRRVNLIMWISKPRRNIRNFINKLTDISKKLRNWRKLINSLWRGIKTIRNRIKTFWVFWKLVIRRIRSWRG